MTQQEEIRFRNPVKSAGFSMLYHAATLDPELSDGAYRTYATYLMYAQQNASCWPGRPTIAKMRNKGASSITRHNTELEDLGYITRERRMGKTWVTWVEDIEQHPRLCILAEQMLQMRSKGRTPVQSLKNERLDYSKMSNGIAQKRAPEEEPVKKNQEEESSYSGSELPEDDDWFPSDDDLQEHEYVDVEDVFDDEKPEPKWMLPDDLDQREWLAIFNAKRFGPKQKRLLKGILSAVQAGRVAGPRVYERCLAVIADKERLEMAPEVLPESWYNNRMGLVKRYGWSRERWFAAMLNRDKLAEHCEKKQRAAAAAPPPEVQPVKMEEISDEERQELERLVANELA